LSADGIIACGMGLGTASEIALALKQEKKVILLTQHQESHHFFSSLSPDNVLIAHSPKQAIELVQVILVRE
jgi:predicted Rossmann-fold nucleotide-binding protein